MASYSADREHGHQQPVCQNCTTSTTPLWRRDEMGSVLCNACGLFLKLHGRPRPISLKTDVIKSRNRVKAAGQGQKRKSLFETNGPAVSQPGTDNPPPHLINNQVLSHKPSSGGSEHSNSPLSRTETPALHHSSNIAPQHIFDGVSLADHVFQSPATSHLRHTSPGSTSAFIDRHLEPPHTYDGLLQANTALKTRVSELEVINDLYRGTVTQYEQGGAAPQAEMVPRESEAQQLRQLLEQSQRREQELKQKVEELEHEVADLREEQPPAKRTHLSERPEYPEPPQVFTNGLDS